MLQKRNSCITDKLHRDFVAGQRGKAIGGCRLLPGSRNKMQKSGNSGLKKKTANDKGASLNSVWSRACTAKSEWPQKDEFLDVIYWARQVVALLLGILWGIMPLKGIFGILLFCIVNAAVIYFYFSNFQKVDEDEFGGTWELTKEGFVASFAVFLVTWIVTYSGLHFD